MAAQTNGDVAFLVACIKNPGTNGNPNWPAVGEATGKTKDAARMYYKGIMNRYKVENGGTGKGVGKAKAKDQKPKTVAPKRAAGEKKRKLKEESDDGETEADDRSLDVKPVVKPKRTPVKKPKYEETEESEEVGEEWFESKEHSVEDEGTAAGGMEGFDDSDEV